MNCEVVCVGVFGDPLALESGEPRRCLITLTQPAQSGLGSDCLEPPESKTVVQDECLIQPCVKKTNVGTMLYDLSQKFGSENPVLTSLRM